MHLQGQERPCLGRGVRLPASRKAPAPRSPPGLGLLLPKALAPWGGEPGGPSRDPSLSSSLREGGAAGWGGFFGPHTPQGLPSLQPLPRKPRFRSKIEFPDFNSNPAGWEKAEQVGNAREGTFPFYTPPPNKNHWGG